MKPRPPKFKPRHNQAQRDYFKSIVDRVLELRENATKPKEAETI